MLFLLSKINNIILFFFPKVCKICSDEGFDICPKCLNLLIPANKTIIENIEVFSCFQYNTPISKLLKDAKYNGKSELANIMFKYLMQFYQKEIMKGNVLIPIPNSFYGQVKRKYNIPNLICLLLSKKLNMQVMHLLKKKNSPSQVGLKKLERNQNAENFFFLTNTKNNLLQNKNIILVDDVFTTGATIQAAIKKLDQLQPNKITVFTFAKRDLTQS